MGSEFYDLPGKGGTEAASARAERLKQRVVELGEELVKTVGSLEQELAASNEELAASNEELSASNEELRSSNEQLHETLAQLRQQEGLLRLFIRNVPSAVAMFDTKMRYLAVSDRWVSDYKLEGRDLVGNTHYEVFPEIPERWKEAHRRCLAGETLFHLKDRFERADGSAQWLNWRVEPWREAQGQVGGLIMFTEDITETVKAERRVRDSEFAYRSLVGHLPDLIVRVGPGLRYLVVNEAFAETTGIPPEEFVGKTPWELGLDPDAVERDMPYWRKAFETGKLQSYSTVVTFPGGVKHYEAKVIPEGKDADGKPQSLLVIATDVTDAFKRRRQLEEQNAELQRAHESLDNFVHAVAHDLRSPVSNLKGLLTLQTLQQPDNPLNGQLQVSAQRLENIVNGLVRMIDVGRTEVEDAKEIHFDNELSMLLEEFADGLAEATVERDLAADSIRYVPAYMQSLLRNLVSNAIKYRRKGTPLRLSVSTRQEKDGAVLLRVEDNGQGIDVERHGKYVFKPFKRIDHSSDAEGTGMGLHLVKSMVERNGGQVWVEGQPGVGATFFARLIPYHAGSTASTPMTGDFS